MNNNTNASPSLPDVKSPEALRYAADVLEASAQSLIPRHGLRSPASLRDEAGRLERKEVDFEAARDAAIERAAQIASQEHEKGIRGDGKWQPWENRTEGSRDVFRSIARQLFDAGLLSVGGTDE